VPGRHLAGPVYYVGTEDLGCYLLRGSKGDILINTGLADSPALIEASLRSLGFDPRDIRILLTNQAHFDHVGGFAGMQERSGAKVHATHGDAPLLETGGASDPAGFTRYRPVKVDRVLEDGEVIALGDLKLEVISTPGHTPGSVSYKLTHPGLGKAQTMFFVNLPTVVMPLKHPAYPAIASDFRLSFSRLKALRPGLWVAAHASQCRLQAKQTPEALSDPAGYLRAVEGCEKGFLEKVAAELP
jgi:metallo-beta-lactamase class B